MRPRLSISGLMGIVIVVAFVVALIIFAIRFDVASVRVAVAILLGLPILVAVRRRGDARAFALGSTVAGWPFFLASILSHNAFPSVQTLFHLYDLVVGSPRTMLPDDVPSFINHMLNFAMIGQALIALICGTTGGLIAVAIVTIRSGRHAQVSPLAVSGPYE